MSYFLKLNPPRLIENAQDVILLPKFRRLLNIDDRISMYKYFMSEAIEKLPNSQFIISIHPEELKYRDKILTREFSNIRIYDPVDITNPMKEYVQLFENAKMVYSDYIGAHIFRAISYFNLNSELTLKTWGNPHIDEKMKMHFDEFLATQNFLDAKKISDTLKKLINLNNLYFNLG
jgi:hypothetical protein